MSLSFETQQCHRTNLEQNSVPLKQKYCIPLLGTRGRSYSGDIAVDDIKFVDCALPPVVSSCSEFSCKRKSCVKRDYVCDYNDDCGDNSDETACGMTFCVFVLRILVQYNYAERVN